MTSMLDDLKLIHERDVSDTLGIAERQWRQLEEEFNVGDIPSDIEKIKSLRWYGWISLGSLS